MWFRARIRLSRWNPVIRDAKIATIESVSNSCGETLSSQTWAGVLHAASPLHPKWNGYEQANTTKFSKDNFCCRRRGSHSTLHFHISIRSSAGRRRERSSDLGLHRNRQSLADADDPADPTNPAMLGQARRRFKKRLNGLINVRTDGNALFAARRVAAGYQFVAYGPIALAARTPDAN